MQYVQGGLLELRVIVLGDGRDTEKLVAHHDGGISHITRWMPWEDVRKVKLVTQSLTLLLCLLPNGDDCAERALVCLLGQGIDNRVRVGPLSADMLEDVVFCGSQGEITDRQRHIRILVRVTM